jgi:hypothetical protein
MQTPPVEKSDFGYLNRHSPSGISSSKKLTQFWAPVKHFGRAEPMSEKLALDL